MGYALKAPGGKVTTTNLTASNIKKGTTVTVRQGSKVVASVNGNAPHAVSLFSDYFVSPDKGSRFTVEIIAPSTVKAIISASVVEDNNYTDGTVSFSGNRITWDTLVAEGIRNGRLCIVVLCGDTEPLYEQEVQISRNNQGAVVTLDGEFVGFKSFRGSTVFKSGGDRAFFNAQGCGNQLYTGLAPYEGIATFTVLVKK